MWQPLAAITRSKRGQKLLQTFLMKPFLIDSHARLTEVLAHLCCCGVSCKTFLMCIYKLMSSGLNVVTVEAKNL